jgi:hypothetical protein
MAAEHDLLTPAEHAARFQLNGGHGVVIAARDGDGWLQAVVEPPALGDAGPDQ